MMTLSLISFLYFWTGIGHLAQCVSGYEKNGGETIRRKDGITISHNFYFSVPPDNVVIVGPKEVKADQTYMYRCEAQNANPAPTIQWIVNGILSTNGVTTQTHPPPPRPSGYVTSQHPTGNIKRPRGNSSAPRRPNSSGNLLSINFVEFSFPQNSWKMCFLPIHLHYSGIQFSTEFVENCSLDELMESTDFTSSMEF